MNTIKQLLMTVAVLLCSVVASGSIFKVDGIYYEITDEFNYNGKKYGSVQVASTSGYEAEHVCTGNVVIPSSISFKFGEYSVTSIGEWAFRDCSGLTSVTIPNSVTSIGNYAFSGCSSLTSIVVESGNAKYDSRNNCNAIIETATNTLIAGCKNTTIPNSVTSIREGAFYGCSGLTNITIPNSVTSIGYQAFYCCSGLTSITIPNSVTTIGWNAFYCCSSLTSITIPNSVTSIGNSAFNGCSGLTSVTIPNSVTSIGNSAFDGCSGLKTVELYCKNIGSWFSGKSSIKEFIIGDAVESIGNYAFSGCSSLTSITIPNSITSIGEDAFYGCSSLTSITIPNSVTSIGKRAFYNCSSISEVHIKDIATWCKINFVDEYSNPLYYGNLYMSGEKVTELVIPNSVESIGNYAFCSCSGLTSVTIPNSVTSIGYVALWGCENLKSVNLSTNISEIGAYAFGDCFSLQNILIPNSVTKIGKYSFSDCTSLTNITIPNSVTSIEEAAFDGCTALNTLIYHSTCSISSNIFTRCDNLSNIVYTSQVPPTSLMLATNTYVPNKEAYAKSIVSSGRGKFIEHVSFQGTNATYGETPKTEFINNLEKFGYTATATMPSISTNAGTHTIDIPFTFTKGNDQFNVNIPYKYTINKASLVVKADSVSRFYGDNNPEFLISYSGFVNGEDENVLTNKGTATTFATAKSDVGIYDIVISGVTADNYEIQYDKSSLTVDKAPLTVAVNNTIKVYGDDNPKFTLEYSGLKNNETSPQMASAFDITTDATILSNVGEYDITISGGEAKNYEITNYTNGKLTVTKAPLTVTASNATKVYGDANPEFKYSYSGAKNNDSESAIFETLPTMSCVANETSNVGEYEIVFGDASSNNYEISYMSGILSVNKREITVSTKNYTRIYGAENPNFEILYNGFVNNEDESVLLIKPKAKTNADKDSDVGTYDITIEGGDDDNYSFAYSCGALTIEKANQTITWEQEFDDLVVGSQIELTAKASSGLDIEYITDNNISSVYSIGSKTYLECFGGGEIALRATQSGNKNYNAAVRVLKVIKIVPTSINSVSANAIVKIDGNCVTILGANNGTVAIYTINGALVEKIDCYAGEEIMLDKGVYIVCVGGKTIKVKL